MRLIICDTEVFMYDWCFCGKDYIDGTEYCFWNDREALMDFMEDNKDSIFIGFNIKGYDYYIMKSIMCGLNPYKCSQWIIKDNRPGYKFSDAFNKFSFNFYEVRWKDNLPSLKVMEGFLGLDIEETEVDFNIDRPLTHEERELTIKYCKHDVDATELVLDHSIERFQSHKGVLKAFKRPMRDLCKTQAELVAKILGASAKKFDDEFDFRLPDELRIEKYPEVIDWFMTPVESVKREMELERIKTIEELEVAKSKGLDPTVKRLTKKIRSLDSSDYKNFQNYFYKRQFQIRVADVDSNFAWGGWHGANDKTRYICKPGEKLLLFDVDQLYPSLMVEYKLISRTVSEPKRLENILSTSLRLKKEGKKKERQPYKDMCNIVYGASGAWFNKLYDPLHRNLVCIFGQLFLLDLVEKLEPYVQMWQYNTDGVLAVVKDEMRPVFDEILQEWQNRTRLRMSVEEYERVYQANVNQYIIVAKDGEYKAVGAYVKKLSPLDNDLPIVNKAIKEYIINGIPPRETIMSCNDLIQYQKIYHISSKYEKAIWCDKIRGGKTFRVFASKDPKHTPLYKWRKEDGMSKFASCPNCFIWNKKVTGVTVPPELDKEFYISLAEFRLYDSFGIKVGEL